jgi:hypothetical protein
MLSPLIDVVNAERFASGTRPPPTNTHSTTITMRDSIDIRINTMKKVIIVGRRA